MTLDFETVVKIVGAAVFVGGVARVFIKRKKPETLRVIHDPQFGFLPEAFCNERGWMVLTPTFTMGFDHDDRFYHPVTWFEGYHEAMNVVDEYKRRQQPADVVWRG